MIDNSRRNVMKFMALLGLATVVGIATPFKESKTTFDANNARVGNGYYGFGETW